MRRPRRSPAVLVLACLMVLGPGVSGAWASSVPIWVGGNIDVHNYTDANAYDFHVRGRIKSTSDPSWHLFAIDAPSDWSLLGGAPEITRVGTSDYWDFNATWKGNTPVQPCEVVHFGLFFDVTCRNVWVDLDGWWTDENGNRIDVPDPTGAGPVPNAWPILGFEFPTPFSDPPAPGDMFRLQPDAGADQIPVDIVQMDLMTVPPPGAPGDENAWIPFLQQLNPADANNFNWTSAGTLPPPDQDGFINIPVRPLGLGEVLVVRTLAQWETTNGHQEEHWFFHLHQAHLPEPMTVLGVILGTAGLAGYIRRRTVLRD